MYEADLRSDNTTNINFYLKNYTSISNNVPYITELIIPETNIQRIICIYHNHSAGSYIKRIYFFQNDLTTPTILKLHQLDYAIFLGKNNILKFFIPAILLDNTLNFPFNIVLRKYLEDTDDLNLERRKIFLDHLLNNKDEIINNSEQLLNDLTKNPESSLFHSLKEGDYILAFFDRNYDKIINFFKSLILVLKENNKDLQPKLFNFFVNFIKNNLNRTWQDELKHSGIDFDVFKDFNLLNCVFTDITNLLQLVSYPDYKFQFYDFDQRTGLYFGNSVLGVLLQLPEDFDEKNIKCIVYDKKQNEVTFKCMFEYTKKKFYFIFDPAYLKHLKITKINCIVMTTNKNYESLNINLTEFLQ